MQYQRVGRLSIIGVHSGRGLGGRIKYKHAQNLWCTAPPLRVERECPLDEGTEWIVGRSTESVGLMYSADCGLRDSGTYRLADSHRKYSWNTFCFADALHCESVRLTDQRTQNTLGRISGLLSILSRMSLYPSLDLRTACYSVAVKIT